MSTKIVSEPKTRIQFVHRNLNLNFGCSVSPAGLLWSNWFESPAGSRELNVKPGIRPADQSASCRTGIQQDQRGWLALESEIKQTPILI